MRYREEKSEDLAKARAAVAEWRDRNPGSTAEQLVADLGGQFHAAGSSFSQAAAPDGSR